EEKEEENEEKEKEEEKRKKKNTSLWNWNVCIDVTNGYISATSTNKTSHSASIASDNNSTHDSYPNEGFHEHSRARGVARDSATGNDHDTSRPRSLHHHSNEPPRLRASTHINTTHDHKMVFFFFFFLKKKKEEGKGKKKTKKKKKKNFGRERSHALLGDNPYSRDNNPVPRQPLSSTNVQPQCAVTSVETTLRGKTWKTMLGVGTISSEEYVSYCRKKHQKNKIKK
ncbi:hypothetical protein RFI_30448, partial [Reticulomyxa filosa]